MSPLLVVAVGVVLAIVICLAALTWWSYRSWDTDRRQLAKRMGRLPFTKKLRLAGRVLMDRRVSWALRLFAVILVLYLAMPFDIIPDFIPVIGYADDLIVVVLGTTLLLRSMRREVLEEQVSRLELEAGIADETAMEEKGEEVT